jgi:hypothetical protein
MMTFQRLVLRSLISTLLLCCAAITYSQIAPTPGTVEAKYYAAGPFQSAVTVLRSFACCDSKGTAYDLYYPPLSMRNKRPIITWANGSNGVPSQYDYFLKHLAGWGFVVIATNDMQTDSGATVWDAAQYLIDANNNPSSPYYQTLDTDNIAVVGHSQGANGSIGALQRSWGSNARPDGKKIKTVVPYALPQSTFCTNGCTTTRLPAGASIFLLNGSLDPISPSAQLPGTSGENSIQAYYDATPAGVVKAKATANLLSHNDIQGQPACNLIIGCTEGVYRLLGYPTAWLLWQLQGFSDAHGVFVKPSGELFGNLSWSYQDSNAQ